MHWMFNIDELILLLFTCTQSVCCEMLGVVFICGCAVLFWIVQIRVFANKAETLLSAMKNIHLWMSATGCQYLVIFFITILQVFQSLWCHCCCLFEHLEEEDLP